MGSSRFNKLGIYALLLIVAVLGSSCSYYNKVMARMNLVDGAAAYNERKFDEAMEKFNHAVEYDPELNSIESKTAQLFLARTLHSLFAGNRRDTEKAERSIEEYKKALPAFIREVSDSKTALDANPADEKLIGENEKNKKIVGSIVSAVGSLYENLQQEDKWLQWQIQASDNAELPNDTRSNSLVALASKEYNCANDITDTDAVKKTVKRDGEDTFQFVKPENQEDYDKLKKCVADGTVYINRAVELNGESDSAWSYKASLLVQSTRVAEMEGDSSKMEMLKKESEEAKKRFEELAEKKRKKIEEAARKKAEEVGGETKVKEGGEEESTEGESGDKEAGEKKADEGSEKKPEDKKDESGSDDNQ